jgi:hypothetical protein
VAGLVDNPGYWRARAEEARTLADSIQDSESRQIMLGIARDYDRMAQRAEEHLKRREKNAPKKT